MTVAYSQHVNRRKTPQSESIPNERQVENNAGGYAYEVDKWARLTRFLVLGTDGGTYYVNERELTRENARVVEACLTENFSLTINQIVNVSENGRAPKNDAAIFALALAAAHPNVEVRAGALAVLPRVCRIPTHLFQFLGHCQNLRRWSRMLRRAVSDWYARWDADTLAFEVAKYPSRAGWAHRDAWRLAHIDSRHQAVLRWGCDLTLGPRTVRRNNGIGARDYPGVGAIPAVLAAIDEARTADVPRLVSLIREHGLTREMVPTAHLNDARVWEALLDKMPLTAMIRNLNKMTTVGLLAPMSMAETTVRARLADEGYLRRSRVHPLNVLNAMRTYASGHGEKGSLTWQPVRGVIDALDDAFYASFGNVEPTNKRLMLALDLSGSMTWSTIAGTALTPRDASAALALVTARVEPYCHIVGFTAGSYTSRGCRTGLSDLTISPRQRLDDVAHAIGRYSVGATDCALPMLEATRRKLDADAFVVYTDNETWAGDIHPSQALRDYRASTNKPRAAQVVVGMTATDFTIADPQDPLTLDVVGFDLATPQAISEFVRSV